jgi:hypothetical protein
MVIRSGGAFGAYRPTIFRISSGDILAGPTADGFRAAEAEGHGGTQELESEPEIKSRSHIKEPAMHVREWN